uniref:Alpha 1,4-glycosyltransferase domain-containing protein n=1 Tax=Timema douglasi TaxID=61478 RepID=A0A7R8ZFR2_TIMDO|nr:unnamed protein product [Timema douglasi]
MLSPHHAAIKPDVCTCQQLLHSSGEGCYVTNSGSTQNYFRNDELRHSELTTVFVRQALYGEICTAQVNLVHFQWQWKETSLMMQLKCTDRTCYRSLKGLAESFVVAESNYYVGSSVMRFTADGLGHQVMEALLEEIRTDFRGDQWAHNGPIIVTKVIQQLCGTNSTKQMTPEQCQGVVIYHPLMFFPVSGVDSKNLFNETLSAITMALIKSSRSYGTHTWNAITADSPIRFGSKQPFSLLAKRFCPSVYYNSGMVF